jgi:hypothetical protein
MRIVYWFIGILVVVITGALFYSLAQAGTANARAPFAAFTLIAPKEVAESQLVARALVPIEAPCPTIQAQGSKGPVTIEMTERRPGATAAPAFSTVLSCSAPLPTGLTEANIAGLSIPSAIPATVDQIAIFADSGCRVDDKRIQDCNDPDAWPLGRIADQIAAAKPDVILNPGDYYYREIQCPVEDAAKCSPGPAPTEGMPFDENDQGWLYEAITPMKPMFPVAPIAFLRGNHEECGRAGNGFFLYFDPRPGNEATCAPVATADGLEPAEPQTTPTWAFDLGVSPARTLRVAMVDNAYGTDKELTDWVARQRISYQEAAALTVPRPGRESWLMTHRPIFSVISDVNLPEDDPLEETWSSDGQMVASYGLLGHYSMILSSHNHFAQAVQIPGQPGSLVMGNGGALLDPVDPKGYYIPKYGPLTKADGTPRVPGLPPYPNATSLWTANKYGYALATPSPQPTAWQLVEKEFTGTTLATCTLADRQIDCR